MTAPLRHENISQSVPQGDFRPILRDEVPYFQNLNRAPSDAFLYSDSINKILSYGGTVSILETTYDPSVHYFNLYEIARIDDNELLVPALVTDPKNSRYGIVVTERSDAGKIIVCTFCPNFVYPSSIPSFTPAPTGTVPSLFINPSGSAPYLSTSATSGSSTEIGFVPIAKVIGTHSIFFSGTLRALTV